MRDIALTLVILAIVPLIFKRPWIGALTWAWLGFMSPHRLTFGFAYSFPFAQVIGIVTLISFFTTRERRHLPLSAPVVMLILLMLWMCVTSVFALHPAQIEVLFMRILKIILMLLATLAVLYTRRHIELLVWVVSMSICFYGFKGGIHTILTGGSSRVWGPGGSFIEGNNELGLALVMTIPLVYYLYSVDTSRWRRYALICVALLSSVAVLGTHSRGAFLAISAMVLVLWFRSHKRALMIVVLGMAVVALLAFMPENWFARMRTIESYEEDSSAMGRINAWYMAWNLATDRWIGGGFWVTHPDEFFKYAPNPSRVLAAHSIYFQMLGEHGFVGLGLFLLLFFITWRMASRIRKQAAQYDDLKWMVLLAGMSQVSFVGFFVGGTFLSLAYFDLPYYTMGIVVLCDQLLKERIKYAQDPQGTGTMKPDAWRLAAFSRSKPATPPGNAHPLPGGRQGGLSNPARGESRV